MITKPEPYCPVCGAKMVLRRPKPNQDWKPFWGCSQYPECKGRRNIDPVTGKPSMDEINRNIPIWGERPRHRDKYDDYTEEDCYFSHPGNHGEL